MISHNTELIKGEIADYRLTGGILYSYSKSPKRTIKNITENIALIKKITANKSIPLLIYLNNPSVEDNETHEFFKEQLPIPYTAIALVSKLWFSKLIMNMLFKLKTQPIPMRYFSDDEKARKWLTQYI